MSETERLLLAAIRATPADDTPRLVYADYLQEHAEMVRCWACEGTGLYRNSTNYDRTLEPCKVCARTGLVSDGRAERGEFIRVQCEIARSGDDFYPDGSLLASDLARRESGFWAHQRKWKDDIIRPLVIECPDPQTATAMRLGPVIDAVERGKFRRGFLATLRGPLGAFWGERGCSSCDYIQQGCPHCHGTGRVSGPTHAFWEVAGREPVETIEVTDKRPLFVNNLAGWRWQMPDPGHVSEGLEYELPREVVLAMRVAGQAQYTVSRYFDTDQDARDALSAALLALARA